MHEIIDFLVLDFEGGHSRFASQWNHQAPKARKIGNSVCKELHKLHGYFSYVSNSFNLSNFAHFTAASLNTNPVIIQISTVHQVFAGDGVI